MEYEVICEIFNQCANNQMRDISFREEYVNDPEEYVRSREAGAVLETVLLDHGVVFIDTDCAGLRKRYTFTPLN